MAATRSCKKRTHFSLLNLCLSGRNLHQRAPLVNCPFKGQHVLNDRAGHPVVFDESVKLQVTQKYQNRADKVHHGADGHN